ncbi:MAG: response regulator [Magnetospirillum sp.]|nr:response regulator [Magnetospirillum sp.]
MAGACVLFVDDEPKVMDGIRRTMFDHVGEWESLFAANGVDALDVMTQRSVAVVVTDIAMPVMDGKALIIEMYERCPDTVVLVLSGHWTASVSQRQLGPSVRFLGKPIAREQLVAAIREALSEARLPKLSAPLPPPDRSLAQSAEHPRLLDTWVDLVEKG